MKKSKRLLAGAGLIMSLSLLTGCDKTNTDAAFPSSTRTPDVTGPAVSADVSPEIEFPAAVYGPPEWFGPANEEVEDVYGPPVEFFDPSDEFETEEPDPSDEEPAVVYGPPSGF
ncbi:MAG: hypothetical protein K5663_00370 [Clostridiales bacterium]|nr:hypothetical protein [Clostridiales bacterium]